MGLKVVKWLKRTVLVLAVSVLTLLAVRAYDAQRRGPLEPWHTYVPHELTAKELAKADWNDYLAAERAIFESLRVQVTQKLDQDWQRELRCRS